MDITDRTACYRAVQSRDRRFDGVFYTAVRTTGIYCRPSCSAVTPKLRNVSFHPTAAAAQLAGFRACRRCRPDATPGSPEWDVVADVAGRAMRLISDGVVERDGVEGLASRLGYSSRHLVRLLTDNLGAGPLALARARRAQTARILIESTPMALTEVAFASGFASVRQFNDTIREVYAASPTELRSRNRAEGASDGSVRVRLAVRAPFDGLGLLDFLRVRAVRGVELVDGAEYSRTLRLPRGHGTATLSLGEWKSNPGVSYVPCRLVLSDLRDLPAAVERCRRLIDADCDPVAVDRVLGKHQLLADSVAANPGLRVPGTVDGDEIAVRAVLGQQVSVAGATTTAAKLVARYGEPVDFAIEGLTHLFPSAVAVAEIDPTELPIPRARANALVGLCQALRDGEIALDRSLDRAEVRRRLVALPGIGGWTADYIALRALGDPDVFLPTDLGARRALPGEVDLAMLVEQWRPWSSYALMHLWRMG